MNTIAVPTRICCTVNKYFIMSEFKKIKVGGMNCNHCKITIENGLNRIPGIEAAIANIVNGEVTIRGNEIETSRLKSVIEELGYFYDGEIK